MGVIMKKRLFLAALAVFGMFFQGVFGRAEIEFYRDLNDGTFLDKVSVDNLDEDLENALFRIEAEFPNAAFCLMKIEDEEAVDLNAILNIPVPGFEKLTFLDFEDCGFIKETPLEKRERDLWSISLKNCCLDGIDPEDIFTLRENSTVRLSWPADLRDFVVYILGDCCGGDRAGIKEALKRKIGRFRISYRKINKTTGAVEDRHIQVANFELDLKRTLARLQAKNRFVYEVRVYDIPDFNFDAFLKSPVFSRINTFRFKNCGFVKNSFGSVPYNLTRVRFKECSMGNVSTEDIYRLYKSNERSSGDRDFFQHFDLNITDCSDCDPELLRNGGRRACGIPEVYWTPQRRNSIKAAAINVVGWPILNVLGRSIVWLFGLSLD
jgi:hypothetical protein